MSGHSRWATIKRKKGAADAKKGKIYTKLSKEITVAARMGGGDVNGNPRLRLAVQAAKAAAMPNDNINRAIRKGTGEDAGGQIEEYVYEGYGPGGVAFIMDIATDNQNRTISEVRSALDKAGGSLGKSGSVSFLFNRRGMIVFESSKYSEDQIMEAALDAGAEDVVTDGEHIVVYTAHQQLTHVKEAMDAKKLESVSAEVTMVPTTSVKCDLEVARKILKLYERLEDNDDVQHVWANFDIPDDIMGAIQNES